MDSWIQASTTSDDESPADRHCFKHYCYQGVTKHQRADKQLNSLRCGYVGIEATFILVNRLEAVPNHPPVSDQSGTIHPPRLMAKASPWAALTRAAAMDPSSYESTADWQGEQAVDKFLGNGWAYPLGKNIESLGNDDPAHAQLDDSSTCGL